MDRHHQRTIVPVTAISTVQMVSGPPIQKAVPEEYALADFILRTFEAREGREVEFALKAYLPLLVMPTGSDGKCFFLDLLGLTSSSIPNLESFDSERLIERVGASETQSHLLPVVEAVRVVAQEIVGAEEILLRGVVSGPLASSLVQLLAWPVREQAEAYSMLFPLAIDQSSSTSTCKIVRRIVELTQKAERELPQLAYALRLKAQNLMAAEEGDLSQTLSRLDLRVAALQKEILGLESGIKQLSRSERHGPKEVEARKLLNARQSALDRDLQRREQMLSDSEMRTRELRTRVNEVESELEVAREVISGWRKCIDSIEVSAGSVVLPEDGVGLFIPLLVAGLSKKGRLDTVVYPPSVLVSDVHKLSRRKDFADSLVPASSELAELVSRCEDQVSKDVSLKKTIRDCSQTRNLLALKNTRAAIREGARLMVAEGLAKAPALDQIESLLSGLPEQSFILESTPAAGAAQVPGRTSDCTIVVHVHDDHGAPIGHSSLETGDLRVEGSQQGVIRLRLWAGSHRARISAPNYRDKTIEFGLQSTTDTVLPVILSRLSREEEIERSLEQLVKRAERIDQIRKRLWDAFEAQGETLLGIPAYRSSLSELLTDLGYEPESWISEAKKKKGMVKRFLKRDDRIDALRRDILRVAEESKLSGGVMLLSALLVRLDAMGWTTDMNEVSSILDGLSRDGLVEGLTLIEGGARLVKFIPVGLTDDPQRILSLAAEKDGHLTAEDAVVGLGWTEERVRTALELLVNDGVAKVQKSYSQSTQYWFPGLRSRPMREQDPEKRDTS